jgi:predicted ATPase
VSAERGLTPFVGRERDIELLHDALERCKTGRGQAVSIVGDAGVGKSRFLYEFRKAVASEDITFLEGKSLSYSRNVAYHPIIDILKSNFDVHDEDGDPQIREKVKKGLQILEAEEASTLPYLLELLSVKDSGMEEIPLSLEAKKNQIIEALKRITLKGSEIRPLILALEDLHWIDRSSEECLKIMMDSISMARVLLIFTYRPDFLHTWGARSYHSQVTLNRLSNRETLKVVMHILRTEEVESDLADFILEKTEGIPFFIEEYIKSLKDLKLIEKKGNGYGLAKDIKGVTIPSTIQDVIMARVDSLPEGAKEVLHIGSVIEREFSYELIRTGAGFSEIELLPLLSILKDAELLYERGIYPEVTYIFKHALTRDVVYDSILSQRRKKLHAEIANAIEELQRDNIAEYFGILAEHYVMGEDWEKGSEYSQLAAENAERAGSMNNAISYAEKRVTCLEKLP